MIEGGKQLVKGVDIIVKDVPLNSSQGSQERQPSLGVTTSHQPSVISYQPSATSHQLSTDFTNCQPPATSCQLPSNRQQPFFKPPTKIFSLFSICV
jgi:hypothetical protein